MHLLAVCTCAGGYGLINLINDTGLKYTAHFTKIKQEETKATFLPMHKSNK